MTQQADYSGSLQLNDFRFSYPEGLVAQFPLENRSSSRMLCQMHPRKALLDHYVTDLPELLPAGSLIILNDSKVFPGRLPAKLAGGGSAEIFLLEKPKGRVTARAQALGRPLKKLRPGTSLCFAEGIKGHIIENSDSEDQACVTVEFSLPEPDISDWINRTGLVPLPPYIKRKAPQPSPLSPDQERYQTVYAGPEGSVAAPTAGLHLDQNTLHQLREKGIHIGKVTLHVGAGTFLPVRHCEPDRHRMHQENYQVPRDTVRQILDTKKEKKPVIAVGTTSLRATESLFLKARKEGCRAADLADIWLKTDLFIHPQHRQDRYHPLIFDGMLTNFHQPESTLFMLVCALLGLDRAHEIYRYAVSEKYRLFSYGDTGLFFF